MRFHTVDLLIFSYYYILYNYIDEQSPDIQNEDKTTEMKGQSFSMILFFMVIDLYISNTAFYMCSLQDSFFLLHSKMPNFSLGGVSLILGSMRDMLLFLKSMVKRR